VKYTIPAILFAGGKSSRMGEDKALLPFENYNTLSEFQYQKLKQWFNEVYISSKTNKFPFPAKVIKDNYSESSPLIGLISVFEQLESEAVFILSVDAPLINKKVVKKLWDAYKNELRERMGRDHAIMRSTTVKAKANPKRVVFSDANNLKVLQATRIVKDEGIAGKVIVLDTRDGKFAKAKAFKESWADLYDGFIEYKGLTEVTDVDPVAKTITFTEYADIDDEKGTVKTEKYEVCNLIPLNKCSPVIAMAGIKHNGAGYAKMDGYSFKSATDSSVYVIGDAITHKIPPSGQTAIWGAHRATEQIIAQLNGKVDDPKRDLPAKAANVCFSIVGGKPEEAIMVTHTFTADEKTGVLKGKGHVPKPKDGNGKFRSKGTAKATREWFGGVMREMFA